MERPKQQDYNFGKIENLEVFTEFISDWNEYSNLLKQENERLKKELITKTK